jgi:DNA (cytosine-5)-methyltransferase 1
MRYASVCSGVEAASLAWGALGWEPVWFSEIEPFPCEVLKQRFPNVPNLGDMTKIEGSEYVGLVDLLVGGTPCQDLSVAGKRAGLAGERSSLALNFVELAYRMECKWFVWENVPGCLSSGTSKGADFATLLSMFTGRDIEPPKGGWGTAGYIPNDRPDRFGVAWRTLDAQFTRTSGFPFAVPQRRRRVFVVGYLGDWTRSAEVLLEPDRVRWDTPPRFKARERFARIAQRSVACSIGNGHVDGLINPPELAQTLNCMHDQQAGLCLNDRGGSVMSVEQDGNAGTLHLRHPLCLA